MNWFPDLHARYAPNMTPQAFSVILNDIEIQLFNKHPEYLELPEKEQNIKVEEALRREIV